MEVKSPFFPVVLHLEFLWILVSCYEDPFVQFQDVSPSPTLFQCKRLPSDEKGNLLRRYMASIGNGHVGTNVFIETVYMNGVYNGFKGESHRARIPSKNNIRLVPLTGTRDDDTFSLDVAKGVFSESFTTGDFRISHSIFVHRYYHSIIVNQIQITSLSSDPSPLSLGLESIEGPPSEDFNFEEETKYESEYGAKTQCGQTLSVESTRYQSAPTKVCLISSDVPPSVTVERGNLTLTLFTAYAKTFQAAVNDFDAMADMVSRGNHEEVLGSHVKQWEDLWRFGHIQVQGNIQLAKIINACQYYILSSLPSIGPTNSPVDKFYGLGSGGLSYGDKLMDYQGHSFWDAEIWIFPSVVYFYPNVAQDILNYRIHTLPAAKDNAKERGNKGARYPWESAFTGIEVTPDCCPETSNFQIHLAGDIAFAVRQYIALTRDVDWLKKPQPGFPASGMELLKEIAQFWISRCTYDPVADQHDIRHVMPPDEDHHDKDNSVYTNVIAAYAIFFAKYASCLVNTTISEDSDDGYRKVEIPDKWVNIAKSLKLLYDPILNYHPEYEGYPYGELIKRADVVLLGFPLMYPMDRELRQNDLLLYGNVTRMNGPALTWSMHSIGFLELDDLHGAEEHFNRSYQPYVREPFKIWSEAKPPTIGAINYLSAMGGFLQAVLSGYGGLRVFPEKIVIWKPRLLPYTSLLQLKGVKYLGNSLDITISSSNVTVTLTDASPKYPLTIQLPNGTVKHFPASRELIFQLQPDIQSFEIKTRHSRCPVPHESINDYYKLNNAEDLSRMSLLLAHLILLALHSFTEGAGPKLLF